MTASEQLFVEHTAQRIVSDFNDLLDAAMHAPTLDDALIVLHAATQIRKRIDAVASRATQRMDELTK